MRNTLGDHITITLFGESHGPYVGAVIDGLRPGMVVDDDFINHCLSLRRPKGKGETPRIEKDEYSVISGVFNGHTTGEPLTILIPNENKRSIDYGEGDRKARPSHVDYVAHEKYGGYEDYRGGGHFSGRLTAPIVASGAIILDELKRKGIHIGCHILELGNVQDRLFENINDDVLYLEEKEYPVLNDVSMKMEEVAKSAGEEGDSVGGVIEVGVIGLPVGVGEPTFSSLEGELANAMFSVPGVKGIEFGLGFGFAREKGSTANDQFYCELGKIYTSTNNNGGINGGISNGMPVVFRIAMRPTATISKTLDTITLDSHENVTLSSKGRHDPCIVRRACIVVRAMTAIVIADLLAAAENRKAQ